jgi:glycosyltransferase involved in cell wall biosynthesis
MENVGVVIPAKNRPEKLEYCLTALARAREKLPFVVDVGDSSDTAKTSEAVRAVCKKFDFVRYHAHHGQNVAAARNFCAQVATAELLINLDDDVYVESDALLRLFEAYQRGQGWRVVAGSVAFGKDWSEPVVMRPIGYGRKPRPGERPSFLVGAFFLYPRALALACPWNERIRVADDMFMGGLWRCKGVALLFEPQARAFHDIQLTNHYVVEWQADGIYANLFDALVANPNIPRAFAYEFLGFAAGAKYWFRRPKTAWAYVAAWYRGHRALVRDWQYLKALVRQPLPEDRPR